MGKFKFDCALGDYFRVAKEFYSEVAWILDNECPITKDFHSRLNDATCHFGGPSACPWVGRSVISYLFSRVQVPRVRI